MPQSSLISQLSDELVKRGRIQRVATRGLDILLASVGILLSSPFMLVALLWVAIDSPGPVLFRQQRVGRGGRMFTMLKFRSMRTGADENVHKEYVQKIYTEGASTVAAKLHNDDRVTRSGKLLRKTSLDELPQLFNILGGSMSLVGPRPVLPYEVEVMGPENLDRFAVKPGLTGPWQVYGRGRVTFLEMMELDVSYARKASVFTDLGLIIRTPLAVLSGKGAK
ncbi:sugar transferase [Fodinicola feengrottensis]|uniref:Sugar transferase n=1 Tax=Fodinicola feengrottensis TaxID=435914 RepID=A0ABP4SRI7_9ACTN